MFRFSYLLGFAPISQGKKLIERTRLGFALISPREKKILTFFIFMNEEEKTYFSFFPQIYFHFLQLKFNFFHFFKVMSLTEVTFPFFLGVFLFFSTYLLGFRVLFKSETQKKMEWPYG